MNSPNRDATQQEIPRWARSRIFLAACVAWIVGAQVWYYLQFRALLRSAIAPLLHRLWPS